MLTLRLDTLHQLLAHAASSADEVCGVLLGRPGAAPRIDAAIAARNVHAAPRDHFLVDAGTLMRADAAGRGQNLAIVGFYHSHPGSAPIPSPTDRADAWPDHLMIIVGGHGTAPAAVCAWRIDAHGSVVPVPLRIAAQP